MFETLGTVVVGYDGSHHARRALHWAMREAAAHHAQLEVLVAAGAEHRGESGRVYDRWAEEWSDEARAILQDDGPSGWTVARPPGSARDVLVEASGPETVVVVGGLGHTALAGAFLGSVSQHLARHANGPVVVVRGEDQPAPARVVVGVDGSPESERALDFAIAHAQAHDLAVTAIYAWPPSLPLGTPLAGPTPASVGVEIGEAERWLAEAVTGRRELHPDLDLSREAVPLEPATALAGASVTASLLVVGSRGRGGLRSALLGSVSQEVLRRSRCPVAIVR